MLVNFLLMCLSVLALPWRNRDIAKDISVVRSRKIQVILALSASALLGGFLVIHIWKDIAAPVKVWYLHSTYIWLFVMLLATVIYLQEFRRLRKSGVDIKALFAQLPEE